MTRRGLLKVGATTGVLGATTWAGLTTAAEAVAQTGPDAHTTRPRVREYWIQADSFLHNLVPTGQDQMMGMAYAPEDSTLWMVGFRAYTPGWGQPLPGNDDIGPNTGVPGPHIRAEVGDTVVVHFRNNDTHYSVAHSMHPHGFRYAPESCGAYVDAAPQFPGAAIGPGQSYTYTWVAEPSSVGTWLYHDHSKNFSLGPPTPDQGMAPMEVGAEIGLFGLIAITDHATPAVDREFFLFFHDLYAADVPPLRQDFDCFNGFAYLGNTPTFRARVGERVRWRIGALGREFHVFHVHGHRWASQATGRPVDSEILGPSTTLTVEYTEDNPGKWLYHCHVTDHMAGGMVGYYEVDA